jgi:hypothetical protein
MAPGTKHLNVYPPAEVAAEWRREAEAGDESLSEYIVGRAEAGRKKFDMTAATADVDAGELADLRAENADLREMNARQRETIDRLRGELRDTDAGAALGHVVENPGVTFNSLLDYVESKTARRVTEKLTAWNGRLVTERIEKRGEPNEQYEAECYYPTEAAAEWLAGEVTAGPAAPEVGAGEGAD